MAVDGTGIIFSTDGRCSTCPAFAVAPDMMHADSSTLTRWWGKRDKDVEALHSGVYIYSTAKGRRYREGDGTPGSLAHGHSSQRSVWSKYRY